MFVLDNMSVFDNMFVFESMLVFDDMMAPPWGHEPKAQIGYQKSASKAKGKNVKK